MRLFTEVKDMGGVAQAVSSLFGGGGKVETPAMPEVPDYEAERKAKETAARQKRAALADKGMAGTILGGSEGDESGLKKKKLLGE
jgi:hypothetical protein